MDILLVNSFYYPEIKGGAEYSVKKLAEQLQAMGNNVVVLCSGSENSEDIVDGIKVIRRRFHSVYHSYGSVRKNLATKLVHRVLDFRNCLNRGIIRSVFDVVNPEVVHTNNLYEITPEIWVEAKKRGIPVVHTVRDFYLMCYKTNLLRKDKSICESPALGCRFYQMLNRNLSKHVMALTAPSEMMIEQVTNRGFFYNATCKRIYNACDYDDITVREQVKKHLNRRARTFVYLGGLHSHKGVATMLDAFMQVKHEEARLIIAGKGTEEKRVKQACEKDNRIKYVGFLSEKDMTTLLEQCDVLVCPSIWNEPFGRVILDAYKNGLPVISSRIGALPEIVQENVTGLLVSPGSTIELKNALIRFLEDVGLADECRKHLLEQLKEFSLERQAEMFIDVYKNLVKRK